MKLLLWTCCVSSVLSWEMSLLHVNDIHARMEETSKYSGPCMEKDKLAGKCFGGLARISKAVQNFKAKDKSKTKYHKAAKKEGYEGWVSVSRKWRHGVRWSKPLKAALKGNQ